MLRSGALPVRTSFEALERCLRWTCWPGIEREPEMSNAPRFKAAYPYQKDVLALPVTDLDAAAQWYTTHFGMREVERREVPVPAVILERDDTRIGFAINGGDSGQDGAAILVSDILGMKDELESSGAQLGNWRIEERGGVKFQVFFVVAPDGLCFYFHEPLAKPA